ncbi:polysaccharide deacetylase family protein [Anaeromyxobacter paludicola]|uniref:Polysaccharide deacetylase n=1 Tax=Anaeromyxobacter paludicola TaxID=2918171 RepID=A0ABM7XED1_9BACT|nr:polysaccharide deacetylase family protein [Anaeromyxobacter paludicola]BDG10173.1 polysaccharide deacetylase [Anaeromyxobacter paludicola]
MSGLAALSIDLDALRHYHRIHGLPDPPAGAGPDPVYAKATARFGELCARLGVRGTVFAVGEELADPAAAAAVRALARGGHEIANHTFSHDYALTRLPADALAAEVARGAAAIAAAVGTPPCGFRAPGYTLTAPLLAALAAQGYRYDSSAFPAAPYWLAKAAVMGLLALRGRPSRAILDRPRVLAAPRAPYRPDPAEPYRPGPATAGAAPGLLELPITTGLLGFPLIGTFVATLPPGLLRAARAGTSRLPLFNLELHGVDLLDASDTRPELSARQRDLRAPASRKLAAIEAFARSLGRSWRPLAEVPAALGVQG